jgi:hypothetical protein
MINTIEYEVATWKLTISDGGLRHKPNPNKLNWEKRSRECLINGCNNTIRINRTSGLCNDHTEHQHDLLLALSAPDGSNHSIPSHHDIINCLIDWSSTRNFILSPFFEKLSFTTLGNVPDVTSLSGEVNYRTTNVPSLEDIFENIKKVVEQFFPENNNSSYQPLLTDKGNIPVIVLANVFMSLVICEEANRGDRWHCRMIRKNESKTTQLGGAMPIVYFAARTFNWGVEMKKASRNFTR